MLSLLTKPISASPDTITYDIFENNSDHIYVINSPHTAIMPTHINAMIASIEDNTREILSLVKDKTKISEKISANLDFLRLSKKYLSREQIESLAKFTTVTERNSRELRDTLQEISVLKSLDAVKRELLHTNTDLNLVYDELESILSLQRHALTRLKDILDSGITFLHML